MNDPSQSDQGSEQEFRMQSLDSHLLTEPGTQKRPRVPSSQEDLLPLSKSSAFSSSTPPKKRTRVASSDSELPIPRSSSFSPSTRPNKRPRLTSADCELPGPQSSTFSSSAPPQKRPRVVSSEDASSSSSSPLEDVPLPSLSSEILNAFHIDEFHSFEFLGKGSFGTVYRANFLDSPIPLAIKEIQVKKKKRIPRDVEHELIFMSLCRGHPNITRFYGVAKNVSNPKSISIVMELMMTDLRCLLNDTYTLPLHIIKSFMGDIISGVECIHQAGVMHKDLKPENILVSGGHILKIADFGLARRIPSAGERVSPHAGTLLYKAPELLLEACTHHQAVDMWAIGCVFLTIMTKTVPFQGHSYNTQMEAIIKVLGTPSEAEWPDFDKLSRGRALADATGTGVEELLNGFPAISVKGLNLLNGLLTMDPGTRISSIEAIRHDWFFEEVSEDDRAYFSYDMPPPKPVRRAACVKSCGF